MQIPLKEIPKTSTVKLQEHAVSYLHEVGIELKHTLKTLQILSPAAGSEQRALFFRL